MIDQQLLEDLLAEVEETLEVEGIVGLYDFSWSLRGLKRGVPESQVHAVCRAAYDEFTCRHALKLVWIPWPKDPARATEVDPDTPLDFDLDPDDPVDTPLLALVPAEPDSGSDRNGPTP